ncbi:hypothetical protein Syun_018486 [Stephania yunnanensis]|uniref:Uncharacterized protein n=1 Tax=Stephania yunnanensis TaxID=152371 RepID=A0AAP0ISD3_9MAGN
MGERRSLVYYNSKKKILQKRPVDHEQYRLPNLQISPSCPTHRQKTRFGLYVKLVRQEEPLVMMIKFFPASPRGAWQASRYYNRTTSNKAKKNFECDDDGDQATTANIRADQPQVLQQHTDENIINVEDYDDIPPCICLDEYQCNFDSWMEKIKKRGHDDQQQQVDDDEEDDQDWIENLESTLEVDDEQQQLLQLLPIHQQFEQHQPQVLQQHSDDNILTVEDCDDIPPCIFLDEYKGNFDSWMETIKKRDHDDQQQEVYDEEEPSPKRAKARVAN